MNRGQFIKLIVVCLFVMLFLSFSGCVDYNGGDSETKDNWQSWPRRNSPVETIIGERLEEHNSTTVRITDINESYVTNVNFELHWMDEDNQKDAGVYEVHNKPDYFNFTVVSPWGEMYHSDTAANYYGGPGQIILDVELLDKKNNNNDTWIVVINCGDCGDQVLIAPSGAEVSTVEVDNGNSWLLQYYYEYHSKK